MWYNDTLVVKTKKKVEFLMKFNFQFNKIFSNFEILCMRSWCCIKWDLRICFKKFGLNVYKFVKVLEVFLKKFKKFFFFCGKLELAFAFGQLIFNFGLLRGFRGRSCKSVFDSIHFLLFVRFSMRDHSQCWNSMNIYKGMCLI